MEFSRQEYWSELPFRSPGDLPDSGIEPRSPTLQWILYSRATREAQEYWSGLPFSSPEDLSDPEIGHGSPALQADSLPSEPPGKPSREVKTINGDIDLKKQKLRNQNSNNPN